ncbi:PREDICTED: papilin-like, partial [Priapulus caudatus]|uniref:Papilin-like n=1 Tax=Priapulus caudatus TaxID=37621 RepID=A0ABM1EQW0_PRICU
MPGRADAAPPLKACQIHEANADMLGGIIGNYRPQCTPEGEFAEIQFHGSSGYSWCVAPDGTELPGTKRPPGRGTPNCLEVFECDLLECDDDCEHGYSTDDDGCPTCSCNSSPCDGVRCPPDSGSCQLRDVECGLESCPKLAVCTHPTCEDVECDDGKVCEMRQVQCVRHPCPPLPSCELARVGVPILRLERIPESICICSQEYNPQCGTDGVTYGNPCEMNCARKRLDYPGECGSRSSGSLDTRERGKPLDICPSFVSCQISCANGYKQDERGCILCECKVALQSEVCRQPYQPSDPTQLISCLAAFRRWFYNSTSNQCERFIYSGCGGNDNNFMQYEDCRKECHSRAPDACEQPRQEGNCNGFDQRWYFNAETRACETFFYTGCGGNDNHFDSYVDCFLHCPADDPSKVGTCPDLSNAYTTSCPPACNSDGYCKGIEKCCDAGPCGSVCVEPNDVTECQVERANSALSMSSYQDPPRPMPLESGSPICDEEGNYVRFKCNVGNCYCLDEHGLSLTQENTVDQQPDCIGYSFFCPPASCEGLDSCQYGHFYTVDGDTDCPQCACAADPCNQSPCKIDQTCSSKAVNCKEGHFCQHLAICTDDSVPEPALDALVCPSFDNLWFCPSHLTTEVCQLQSDCVSPKQCCDVSSCRQHACVDPSRKSSKKPFDPCRYGNPLVKVNDPTESVSCWASNPCPPPYECNTEVADAPSVCCPRAPQPGDKRPSLCAMPRDSGPCSAAIRKWFFNSETEKCEQYLYGGCQGNENRFDDKSDCDQVCFKEMHLILPGPLRGRKELDVARQDPRGRPGPRPCICTADYTPVCGDDGKTYSNQCALNCDKDQGKPNLKVAHPGACQESLCICTQEYNPQCGTGGKTYGNPCEMNCAKATLDYSGECRSRAEPFNPCRVGDPIPDPRSLLDLGLDSSRATSCPRGYSCNTDIADRAAVCCPSLSPLPIPDRPCVCTREYNPQCGTDGVSYGNPCELNCAKRSNQDLTVDYPARVEEEAEPFNPCRVGEPIPDPSSSVGSRTCSSRTPCPRGYSCNTEIADRAAVCCPAPVIEPPVQPGQSDAACTCNTDIADRS